MFINVVLPAPFSPNSARTSPRPNDSEIPSFATRSPKRLVMPAISRTGVEFELDSAVIRMRPHPEEAVEHSRLESLS